MSALVDIDMPGATGWRPPPRSSTRDRHDAGASCDDLRSPRLPSHGAWKQGSGHHRRNTRPGAGRGDPGSCQPAVIDPEPPKSPEHCSGPNPLTERREVLLAAATGADTGGWLSLGEAHSAQLPVLGDRQTRPQPAGVPPDQRLVVKPGLAPRSLPVRGGDADPQAGALASAATVAPGAVRRPETAAAPNPVTRYRPGRRRARRKEPTAGATPTALDLLPAWRPPPRQPDGRPWRKVAAAAFLPPLPPWPWGPDRPWVLAHARQQPHAGMVALTRSLQPRKITAPSSS